MKTTGVLAVSMSASGFAMATIAQGKSPDESALRTSGSLQPTLSDELDELVDAAAEEEE